MIREDDICRDDPAVRFPPFKSSQRNVWHSCKSAFQPDLNGMAATKASRLASILRGEMHDKALAFRA
jgi:hypothetical protein